MNFWGGPQPQTHEQRMNVALEHCERLESRYGTQLLGVTIYGSTARGTDTAYSDVEMLAVLVGEGIEQDFEGLSGPNKVEINVLSEDKLLEQALKVDERWSVTHGQYVYTLPLLETRAGLFESLKKQVLEQSDALFEKAMRGLLTCEIFESIGKLRSAVLEQNRAGVTWIAPVMAQEVAWLLGLAHRHLYRTGSRMLEESLALPDLPHGYLELCQMVCGGDLHSVLTVREQMEALWQGLEGWTLARNLDLTMDGLELSG